MLAALISPPGKGALAVVHLCGAGAAALAAGLLGGPPAERPRLFKTPIDELMARLAPGFTGEETVEFTCHGGAAVTERLLAALEALGAVRATPAELLERGRETGALDALRAEAWALLPRARTELAARMLQDQADGAWTEALKEPRDVAKLLATAPLGIALATPRRVVLAGSPNAGKSTLFNALAREERALVSPLPGTTRDPVKETIAIEQVPIEIVDTAGVDEPKDLLEQLSMERTRTTLREADVILFLFDAEAGARGSELRFLESLSHRRMILLVNKIDAGNRKPLLDALPLSAKTGQGLDELRRRILHALQIKPSYEEGRAMVFTERQERLLRRPAPLEELRADLFQRS
jgi:tRNA modification GTPase